MLNGREMHIKVSINGQDERLEECSLATLVSWKGLASGSLVVELNGRIIKQDAWDRVVLQQDDVLELLNFVGGG